MRKTLLLLVSLLVAGSCFAQPPSGGLLAYYPFNQNADDESGNGLHAVVNGASLTIDRYCDSNKAFEFDGIDDYIEIPETGSLHLLSGFSLAAWVRFAGANENVAVFCKHSAGNCNGMFIGVGYVTVPHTNQFSFYTDCNLLYSPGTYNDDEWHLVVGTFDGEGSRLYLDTLLVASGPATYSRTNGQNFRIGMANSAQSAFEGKIDDVALYDRALTLEEVRQFYFPPPCCWGITGNTDGDPGDIVDITDLSFMVDFLFFGGSISSCRAENDVDGTCIVDISDLQMQVDFLFFGAALPNCP